MPVKAFVLAAGVIYLVLGLCGFVPAFVYPPPERSDFWGMKIAAGYGFLFGFLPTNIAHNLVYVLIGAAGIFMAMTLRLAIQYARLLCWVTLLFMFLGISPEPAASLGGFLPLFDFNVGVHTVTAVLAWYFGFIYGYEERYRVVAEG